MFFIFANSVDETAQAMVTLVNKEQSMHLWQLTNKHGFIYDDFM